MQSASDDCAVVGRRSIVPALNVDVRSRLKECVPTSKRGNVSGYKSTNLIHCIGAHDVSARLRGIRVLIAKFHRRDGRQTLPTDVWYDDSCDQDGRPHNVHHQVCLR